MTTAAPSQAVARKAAQFSAKEQDFDVIVLGSGAAGLTTALHLGATQRVAVVSKASLDEGSTRYAQGGISAVLDAADSFDAHVADTLEAGAGLCDETAVRRTIEAGPLAIEWLLSLGVPFTRVRKGGRTHLHLTQEGGHSARRVVHAADATGAAVQKALADAFSRTPLTRLEQHVAIDLIIARDQEPGRGRVCGVYVLDLDHDRIRALRAPIVVLATGGAARVYLYSSNPDGATGDGIAMAWRAGCRIANMEFMQFHPTCLFHPKAKSFLISEAVRGEGGLLKLPNGERFMPRYDDRAELAPRDIVARAIDAEMKRLGLEHVLLDISHRGVEFVERHFPMISQRVREFGFDLAREPIPIVPAAHYTCGGVVVDEHGQTDIDGLYAAGEVAYTGLHGANRMASNSLLECLVYARAAAEHIQNHPRGRSTCNRVRPWDASRVTPPSENVTISHDWDELRRIMWDYVGIVRTTNRLERAAGRIRVLNDEIHDFYSRHPISADLIELRNLGQVAELVVTSALSRHESRGLHYSRDYPETNPSLDGKPTVLDPSDH
ncbi:MAG: L-aspartate oxidase [Thioalkalivibrionaceae bacterium]